MAYQWLGTDPLDGWRQRLKRTGWVNNKVALPESVADHMYRMGMCCMLIDEANAVVDRSKYALESCDCVRTSR
jgi:5'-deoxynucleotidase YfbR-like HD superfamily hydrolase